MRHYLARFAAGSHAGLLLPSAAKLQDLTHYVSHLFMNWDDLRILIAIRDEGSYARAGARLRIDETTIARRLARLQSSLGARLFDAIDGARQPTAYCKSVLEHAEQIERQVAAITSIGTNCSGVCGRIRIATTPSIADEVLAPRAGVLLRENPGLTLQFLASGVNVNFSRWEADLAVRLGRPTKGDFSITKLAQVRLFYFEPANSTHELSDHIVCAYPTDLDATAESRFLALRGIKEQARLITESPATIRELIQSSNACGILPEYACRSLLEDSRFHAEQLPQRREVWLLVQTHLKRDAVARRTIEWLRDVFVDEVIG